MDGLERLLAIEEIKTLEARRGRLLDTQDWEAFAALHIPDIVSQAAGPEPLVGVAAMVAWLRAELAGSVSVHHVHSPEIEFASPAHARAIWAMEAMTMFRRPDRPAWRHAFGFYHVDYEHRQGRWMIGARRQERLRVDTGGGPTPL
jgi:hypothetical protein